MKKRKDWFKPKKYPHIGLPLEFKDRHKVECYVKNPLKISQHSFLPLIHREQVSHRYVEKEGIKIRISKHRPISYASHLDTQIYSYYGQLLGERYERYLCENGYGECIIAYRSIPREDGNGNKCNIDLAKDSFDHIRKACKKNEQTIIIGDIKSFFDNLDHKLLKIAWKEISCIDSLPNDEYSVFKNVTRYAYVHAQELFNIYRSQIICQQKTKKTNKALASMKYFRDKNAIAFCNKEDIEYIRKLGLIHKNRENKGIPQGLPISAVLANIYMWNFDRKLFEFINSVGGYYRRYSDDIIIICNKSHSEKILTLLKSLLAEVKLEIAESKTKLFSVKKDGNKIIISDKNTNRPSTIEYLGLAFDGDAIRLKNKSISKYYQKMQRTINAKTHFAINKTDATGGKLFVKQLLRKYTPIGSKKHKIYHRDSKDKSLFIYKGEKSFGNFWTYVSKASRICKSPELLQQLKRNKPILKKRIKRAKLIIKDIREIMFR